MGLDAAVKKCVLRQTAPQKPVRKNLVPRSYGLRDSLKCLEWASLPREELDGWVLSLSG